MTLCISNPLTLVMEFAKEAFMTKALMGSRHFTSDQIPLLWTISIASILFLMAIKILNRGRGKNLPPGNLGLPLIGETLPFMKAYKANKANEWVQQKLSKYGHVFKTSLMGRPTIVITGQPGNRFVFQHDYTMISNKQTSTMTRLLGPKNLFDLPVDDHKRIRGAIMTFMKPEALQKFVRRMESGILQHFAENWEGKESITVAPLMYSLTFRVACDLLFGLEDENERKALASDITPLLKGGWALPLNLPGTTFHGSLKARERLYRRLSVFVETRRKELQEGKASPSQDLMSCLLSIKDENDTPLADDEIIDNTLVVMLAGHDNTTVLFTQLVRFLALNPTVYHNILQEQKEVLVGKEPNEPLQWEDIHKMKYTWKVAQETLRFTPPLFGGFKTALQDVEYGGYTIPKGWQIFWTTTTHWDEEVFKEPQNFDPTHFGKQPPPYTYLPFAAGPRIFPGYDFAKIETIIFLHHLVSKYKWSIMFPDEKLICDPLPKPTKNLAIKLHPKDV